MDNITLTIDTGDSATTVKQLREYLDSMRGSIDDVTDALLTEKGALAETRDAIKSYQEQQAKGKKLTDEQYRTLMALTEQEAEQKQQIAQLSQAYKTQIKDITAADGSYDALNATLGRMRATYRQLSEEERNGGLGQTLLVNIRDIDRQLKEMDASMGNHQRNVGNYASAVEGLSPILQQISGGFASLIGIGGDTASMLTGLDGTIQGVGNQLMAVVSSAPNATAAFKMMKDGVVGLGNSFKALLANPIVLLIAGITAAITSVVKAIKSSEQQTQRMTVVLAPLNAAMDWLVNLFQKGSEYIVQFAEFMADSIGKVIKWAGDLPIIGKYFKDLNEWREDAISLAEKQNALALEQRQLLKDEAATEAKTAKLRADAYDKENFSAQQRLGFLKQAAKGEEEIAKRKYDLAKKQLAIAEEEASRTQNNAATNNKLAEAQAAVSKAQQAYDEKRRTLNREILRVQREITGEQKKQTEGQQKQTAADQEKLNRINSINDGIYLANLSATERELELLRRKYEEERALFEKYGQDTTALTQKYEDDRLRIITTEADKQSKARLDARLKEIEEMAAFEEKQNDNSRQPADSTNALENIRQQIAANESLLVSLDAIAEQKRQAIIEEQMNDDLSIERAMELEAQLIAIDTELYAKKQQLRAQNAELDKKYQKESAKVALQQANQVLGSVGSMFDALAGLYEDGSKEQKKMQIAGAVMNGLAGVANAIAGAMAFPNPILAPILGAINAATVVATTAAQIRKIQSDTNDISGDGSVAAATPATGQLLDNGIFASQLGTDTELDLQAAKNTRVYVLESDITNAQDAVKTHVDERNF